MEIWDILDINGLSTGKTIVRGDKLQQGEYHLAIHVWLKGPKGRFLIQKRAANLELKPGIWATTGGSVISGENSITAAIRETEEELGITVIPENLTLVKRIFRNFDFVDVYEGGIDDIDPNMFPLGNEVDEARWVSQLEILEMVKNGLFVDYGEAYFLQVFEYMKKN